MKKSTVFLVMHDNYDDTYCESVWRKEDDARRRAEALREAEKPRKFKLGGNYVVEMRDLG